MFTFPSCAWCCCCCSLHNRCRLLANGGIEEWMATSARITSVFSFSKSTTFSRTFQTNTQQCWHHFSDSPARCLWRKSCKYPSTRVPASFRVTSTKLTVCSSGLHYYWYTHNGCITSLCFYYIFQVCSSLIADTHACFVWHVTSCIPEEALSWGWGLRAATVSLWRETCRETGQCPPH